MAMHDHQVCINYAMQMAEGVCKRNKQELTPLRQAVLKLIWSSHQPVTAYQILADLSKKRKMVAPPTVYRTLDFLEKNGLIHKIESLKAFIGCSHPDQNHGSVFLICRKCNYVQEELDMHGQGYIDKIVNKNTFLPQSYVVEVIGFCKSCL